MKRLNQLRFQNRYYSLGPTFFSAAYPQGLKNPHLISASHETATLIGLDPAEMFTNDFVQCFSGNQTLTGMQALAMVYAGHQFGTYVPRLGDGRAMLLGEITGSDHTWEIVLKGAGPTSYSRNGDGRAVLRSSIREYLCSEAMAALGIPTTRALCLIGGDDHVIRETIETSAIVTRVAPTHIRFGSFEYFSHSQQTQHSLTLMDYVIAHHFPHLALESQKHALFFAEVVRLTARLIAQWQAVGFSHGVMNTDNMSIVGLTLDYGPFGFMDDYEPGYICNHSDIHGRYAFDQQAQIGLWNCHALAMALSPFIEKDTLVDGLKQYEIEFMQNYYNLMRKKLGFKNQHPEDVSFIDTLLALMAKHKVDYTHFFRSLCSLSDSEIKTQHALSDLFNKDPAFVHWLALYFSRVQHEGEHTESERTTLMKQTNPKYVLRNHLLQIAIEKAEKEKDFSEVNLLLDLIRRPFDEQTPLEHYADSPPDWSKKIVISCSS